MSDVAGLDVRQRKIGKEAPPQPSSQTRDFWQSALVTARWGGSNGVAEVCSLGAFHATARGNTGARVFCLVFEWLRGCLVPLVFFFNTYYIECLTHAWNVKYRLITKLIAQVEINLRDEYIKPN
jgi:hypothetical protein